MRSLYRIPTIRIVFWISAVFLGICQTWFVRHTIFSDGISYLDIASNYLSGDWHNAVNPYWSPLYSWAIAFAFLILHPTLYWQVAALHVVNFGAYVASLAAFEFFMSELLAFRERRSPGAGRLRLSDTVLYIAGCCAILFAGLSLIGIGYCSPDMMAMALTLLLTALLIRFDRTGGSIVTYALFGVTCGLFFLARTAFAPIFLVSCVAAAFLLRQKVQAWPRAIGVVVLAFLALTIPFVTAISLNTGHFTIGEAGKLNYGWEVAGAARYAHWQGEPNDIGSPKHSTTLVNVNPNAYTFTLQEVGTYSPWYNPAFWYEGLKPKIKLSSQFRVLLVNISVLFNLLVRSPLFLTTMALLFLAGLRRWPAELFAYWPVLLPSLASLGLYCVVYLEKRYVAGNFAIIWIVMLSSVSLPVVRSYKWLPAVVTGFCLLYTAAFVVRRQAAAVKISFHDLIHGEEEGNVSFMLAERLRKLGLKPDDRVAVIGAGVDADWARLDHLKIVGEIPLIYNRNEVLFNNTLNLSAADIKGFWKADPATQTKILNAFRLAGAKLVVADATFSPTEADRWPALLDPNQPHLPKPDPETGLRANFRYKMLSDDKTHSNISVSGSNRLGKNGFSPNL